MGYESLSTKYMEHMDRTCPHAYYPRPSMVRDSYLSLNGEWGFAISDSAINEEYGERILVPFPPESTLSSIGRTVGKGKYMHYYKRVRLPEGFVRDRILLHIGAVDQEAWVYAGGELVCESRCGYLPIEVDITRHIRGGVVDIHIVCRDSLDVAYPYGKQTDKRGGMWYTQVSGIWQSVWLESVPDEYICKLKFTSIEGGVHLDVLGIDEGEVILDSGEVISFSCLGADIRPEAPHLWFPEDPYIYRIRVRGGEDEVESYFAIRKIDIRNIDGTERICLNGEPYVFNGLLDQGYYPDGLFLPATKDGWLDDIRMAKSLGFNMLRKHIKIEPEIFYYLCDTEGIAVFQDMVNNSGYSFIRDTALPTLGLQRLGDRFLHRSSRSREIFKKTMLATSELLYNHPSVVYYTIFNEGWGQFSADEMYDRLKAVEPDRIIDATSGWFRRKKSDVDSRHIYFKALEPKGLDGRPLVISEFGGYSYRAPGHLFGNRNYGYRLFKSKEELEDAIASLYEDEVLPLVMRGASAFVYTQVSDVEDETNGFVTYDRRVLKVDKDKLAPIISRCSGKQS